MEWKVVELEMEWKVVELKGDGAQTVADEHRSCDIIQILVTMAGRRSEASGNHLGGLRHGVLNLNVERMRRPGGFKRSFC